MASRCLIQSTLIEHAWLRAQHDDDDDGDGDDDDGDDDDDDDEDDDDDGDDGGDGYECNFTTHAEIERIAMGIALGGRHAGKGETPAMYTGPASTQGNGTMFLKAIVSACSLASAALWSARARWSRDESLTAIALWAARALCSLFILHIKR